MNADPQSVVSCYENVHEIVAVRTLKFLYKKCIIVTLGLLSSEDYACKSINVLCEHNPLAKSSAVRKNKTRYHVTVRCIQCNITCSILLFMITVCYYQIMANINVFNYHLFI